MRVFDFVNGGFIYILVIDKAHFGGFVSIFLNETLTLETIMVVLEEILSSIS